MNVSSISILKLKTLIQSRPAANVEKLFGSPPMQGIGSMCKMCGVRFVGRKNRKYCDDDCRIMHRGMK